MCGGDGSACETIEGVFNPALPGTGKNPSLCIPRVTWIRVSLIIVAQTSNSLDVGILWDLRYSKGLGEPQMSWEYRTALNFLVETKYLTRKERRREGKR